MHVNQQSINQLVIHSLIIETETAEIRVRSKSTCEICKHFSGAAMQRLRHVQTGHVHV